MTNLNENNEGLGLYNILKNKLEIDEKFLQDCFFTPHSLSKPDITTQHKNNLMNDMQENLAINKDFRNVLRSDLIQTEEGSDPELFSQGGYPCNRCNRTRKVYSEGTKQLNHPSHSRSYNAGIQSCVCVNVIDPLLNYKLIKDELIEANKFWDFATHRNKYKDKGSIVTMIRERDTYSNFYKILKNTVFDLTGQRMEKLSELKNHSYPKDQDAKPIILKFKESFTIRYYKSELFRASKNCYEEQLDFINQYTNSKIKYVLDIEALVPVHRPIQHRNLSYDTKMKMEEAIGKTNSRYMSNDNPEASTGGEFAI